MHDYHLNYIGIPIQLCSPSLTHPLTHSLTSADPPNPNALTITTTMLQVYLNFITGCGTTLGSRWCVCVGVCKLLKDTVVVCKWSVCMVLDNAGAVRVCTFNDYYYVHY